MAAKYFKDGKSLTIDELKVELFAGTIAPADVDMKALVGATPKDKKDLEIVLETVVQMTNARRKTTEDALKEDAKKKADEKVKDLEVSKLQRKLESATSRATFDAAEMNDAKAMLDADPSSREKAEFYASCRKQVYDDYVEVYKLDGEIRKKEDPDNSSTIDESVKRRIKGLELKLGIASPSADPLTPAPSTTTTTVPTTASTRSSIVLEPYKKPNGELVNTVLTYNGEPISENDLKSALKRFGATINDVSVHEASEYMGQILVGDEVAVLTAFRRKKLSS